MIEVVWADSEDPPPVGMEAELRDALGSRVSIQHLDSVEGAVEAVGEDTDCVVSEYRLKDGTALDLFAQVRKSHPDTSLVLYTETDFEEIEAGEQSQTLDYVPKPGGDVAEVVAESIRSRTQLSYPLPGDEEERLMELRKHDVDELSTQETFNRLTELAAKLFDARTAFVGIVSQHQENFVGCYGIDWPTLSREDTVCTYGILDDSVMVVEDIESDPRFQDSDLLRELGLRFYAGAPITTENGHRIGMFCLLDTEPRSLDDMEKRCLRLFADEVREQMELRRRIRRGETE